MNRDAIVTSLGEHRSSIVTVMGEDIPLSVFWLLQTAENALARAIEKLTEGGSDAKN